MDTKRFELTPEEIYKICHPLGGGLSTDPDDLGDYSWQNPDIDR